MSSSRSMHGTNGVGNTANEKRSRLSLVLVRKQRTRNSTFSCSDIGSSLWKFKVVHKVLVGVIGYISGMHINNTVDMWLQNWKKFKECRISDFFGDLGQIKELSVLLSVSLSCWWAHLWEFLECFLRNCSVLAVDAVLLLRRQRNGECVQCRGQQNSAGEDEPGETEVRDFTLKIMLQNDWVARTWMLIDL
jgi:hypothetical protein